MPVELISLPLASTVPEPRPLLLMNVKELPGSRTRVPTPRASVLEKVDHILVLEDGALVAQGSHQQLLHTSDFYRETFELQESGGER